MVPYCVLACAVDIHLVDNLPAGSHLVGNHHVVDIHVVGILRAADIRVVDILRVADIRVVGNLAADSLLAVESVLLYSELRHLLLLRLLILNYSCVADNWDCSYVVDIHPVGIRLADSRVVGIRAADNLRAVGIRAADNLRAVGIHVADIHAVDNRVAGSLHSVDNHVIR